MIFLRDNSEEVFYLVCLKQFGKFASKTLDNPLEIESLLEIAFQENEEDNFDEKTIQGNIQVILLVLIT